MTSNWPFRSQLPPQIATVWSGTHLQRSPPPPDSRGSEHKVLLTFVSQKYAQSTQVLEMTSQAQRLLPELLHLSSSVNAMLQDSCSSDAARNPWADAASTDSPAVANAVAVSSCTAKPLLSWPQTAGGKAAAARRYCGFIKWCMVE